MSLEPRKRAMANDPWGGVSPPITPLMAVPLHELTEDEPGGMAVEHRQG